mmetsp:Transcript_42820/g.62705  ORF Transcript_42820/g.62705 Transcript_42820/m.62705 type:complete len:85 (-) Transcript_42820:392-646(-)
MNPLSPLDDKNTTAPIEALECISSFHSFSASSFIAKEIVFTGLGPSKRMIAMLSEVISTLRKKVYLRSSLFVEEEEGESVEKER